jgi:hypothetical protein
MLFRTTHLPPEMCGVISNVKVIDNIAHGYERIISVLPKQGGQVLVAHSMELSEYLEPGEFSTLVVKGNEYSFEFSITLVNKYSIHDRIEQLEFEQPIQGSPAIVAKARICEVIDDDQLLVFVPGLGEAILVDFERDVEAKIDEFIVIEGQLDIQVAEVTD